MTLRVEPAADGHRLVGPGVDVELANRFLAHLAGRNFPAATRRAYAYDVLSFLRFCDEARLALVEVCPTDVFDYLGWRPRATAGHVVVRLQRLETAPATKNRRVAALRALFEHLVLSGVRSSNPVPGRPQGPGWVTTPRAAGPSGQRWPPDRWPAGGAAPAAAGVFGVDRRGDVLGGAVDRAGPGDGAGHAVGAAAVGGGSVVAADRC